VTQADFDAALERMRSGKRAQGSSY
jgi:hypothetical protein